MNELEEAATQEIKEDPQEIDSALGSELDTASTTASIRSSLYEKIKENGRAYHKYREERQYILPEDDREQERLDLQHALFLQSLNNRLFLAPVETKDLNHVLDMGTGTGQVETD